MIKCFTVRFFYVDIDYGAERCIGNAVYSEKFYLSLDGWLYMNVRDDFAGLRALRGAAGIILIREVIHLTLELWEAMAEAVRTLGIHICCSYLVMVT